MDYIWQFFRVKIKLKIFKKIVLKIDTVSRWIVRPHVVCCRHYKHKVTNTWKQAKFSKFGYYLLLMFFCLLYRLLFMYLNVPSLFLIQTKSIKRKIPLKLTHNNVPSNRRTFTKSLCIIIFAYFCAKYRSFLFIPPLLDWIFKGYLWN